MKTTRNYSYRAGVLACVFQTGLAGRFRRLIASSIFIHRATEGMVMSGIDVRKMSDSLLKGLIAGMGPLGLPAQILLARPYGMGNRDG